MTDKTTKPFWGLVNGQPLRIRTMAATGPFGSGKSLLGDMIDPKNTLKIDVESSSTAFNLPFRKHAVMYDEISVKKGQVIPRPIDCWEWFCELIKTIEPGEYTVVSVDPINELQQGAYDWVVENCDQFGFSKGQAEKMSGMVWGHVSRVIDQQVGLLCSKIETFYYVLHEGNVWSGGKPVEGKKKAKGAEVFRKMADVIFVLDRPVDRKTGKQVAAPNALIIPPIGKSRLVHANADTGEIQPILPPHIEGITADKIRDYIAKPPNYKSLKKSEVVPAAAEMTEEERLNLQLRIAEEERETAEIKSRQIDAAVAGRERAEAANSAKVEAKKEPTPTAELPTQSKQNEPDMAKTNLSRADRESRVKELVKEAGMPREKFVAVIVKRGGESAKLADLTDEQLEEIRVALSGLVAKQKEGGGKK